MRRGLSILYIILLVFSLLTITPINTTLSNSSGSSTTFYLHKVWETTISGDINISMPSLYVDLDGDGVNDVIVSNEYINGSHSICVLSGATGQLYGCYITSNNITGAIPVGDVNGNGYEELVISLLNVNEAQGSTTIYFILWDPIANTVIKSKSTTVSAVLNLGYIPGFNMVYENGVVKEAFIRNTETGSDTYIVSYDVTSNTITYTVEQQKVYLEYTTLTFGDLDNDGVVELTDQYKIITYVDFSQFLTTFTLVSYLEVYSGGQKLFSKSYENTIPVIVGVGYNGVDNYVWSILMEMNIFAGTYSSGVACYKLDGSTMFENMVSNAAIYGAGVLGDSILFVYNDTETGNIYGDLHSTINGSRLLHKDLTGYDIQMITISGGLGDVDDNGYKDVLMAGIDTLYVLETNGDIYRVQANVTLGNMIGIPVVETSSGVYIVLTTPSSSVNVEAYTLKTTAVEDNTPPVIIVEKPKNNTLYPAIYEINILVYDNETDVTRVEAHLYCNETGESREVSLTLIEHYGNVYHYWGLVVENTSGDYTLTVTARNSAGLESKAYAYYQVDAEPPEITIHYPRDGDIFSIKETPIKINFTVQDTNLENWTLYVNNQTIANGTMPGNYVFYVSNDTLYPGTNYIYIVAFDEAGNIGYEEVFITYYPGPFKFNLTVLNPEVFEEPVSGTLEINYVLYGYSDINTSDLMFKIYSSGFILRELVKTVNKTYVFNASDTVVINVSDLDDGYYDIEVTIYVEGYGEYTLYKYTWFMIDNNPPELNVVFPVAPSGYVNVSNVTIIGAQAYIPLTYSVQDIFLESIKIYVDDNLYYSYRPWFSWSETINITATEGEHVLKVVAFDEAGHNTTYTVEFILDITPPKIEGFNVVVNETNITVSYKVSDAVSGVDYVVIKVYGENYTETRILNSTEDSIVFTNLTLGNYTVEIKVYDKVGLMSSQTKEVRIEAPTPPTTSPATQTPTPTPSPTSTPKTTPSSTSPTASPTQPAGGVPATLIAVIIVVVIVIALAVYFLTKK